MSQDSGQKMAEHSRLVFPLMGGPQEGDATHLKRIFGTAFSIGGGFFVTAGHSLKAASNEDAFGLGYGGKGPMSGMLAEAAEIWQDVDIGVLQVDLDEVDTIPWEFSIRPLLFPVATVGFPHGYDHYPEGKFLRTRGLQGYIVTATTSRGPQIPSNGGIYDVSFQCPKMMSGAPLLNYEDPVGPASGVVGVVVGNGETAIEIGTDTEEIDDGETIVRRELATYYGVAVRSGELKDHHSSLLGGTLERHLERQGLIIEEE